MKYLFLCFSFCVVNVIYGQYEIGHTTFSFEDADRNDRNVFGEIYYPSNSEGDDVDFADGQFPLIIFGHGFAMQWSEYSVWWETLVPQGYIIAFPRTENGLFPAPSHEDFGLDFSFLVNTFLDLNNTADDFYYQQLSGKNAVIGHSMGGGCSYIAGQANPNINTIISLAAAETSPSAIAAANDLSMSVLNIAGSKDCVVMTGGAPIDIYEGTNETNYRAYIKITDASHCQFSTAASNSICFFGEMCSDFISSSEQHIQMFLAASLWLDYYLKGDCDAWATFQNNLTTNVSHEYMDKGPQPVFPQNPVIEESGNGLTTQFDDTYQYQWYLNDVIIADATNDVFVPTAFGSFTVAVTNAEGCGDISEPYFIDPERIKGINDLQFFSCTPTIVTDELTITLEAKAGLDLRFVLVNSFGISLKEERHTVNGKWSMNWPTNNLPSGMYYLILVNEKNNGRAIQSFIKVR